MLIEHPVNHGRHSLWPIKGREKHSTLFETTIFLDFTKDVPGERVFTDQCMFGAATRKTTQWWCNDKLFSAAHKYLSAQCSEQDTEDHPYPHTASLVGKDDQGQWKSKGSDEYKPPLCKNISLAILDKYIFDEADANDPTTSRDSEHVVGGGDDHDQHNFDDGSDDGSDNNSDDNDSNGDEVIDNAEMPDTAFEALKSTVEEARAQATLGDASHSDVIPSEHIALAPVTLASDPPDPFPSGSRVDVFWTDPDGWYTGTITSTSVWRGEKGKSRNPRRHISITYVVIGISFTFSFALCRVLRVSFSFL